MKLLSALLMNTTEPGFTLIELMVTIVIAGLLMSAAVASYVDFNNRQEVTQSTNDFMVALRTAQTRATVGDKPAGCDRLISYQISGAIGEKKYYLNAICTDKTYLTIATYTTRGSVILVTAVDAKFQALTGVPDPTGGAKNYLIGNTSITPALCQTVTPALGGRIGYNAITTCP